MKEFFSFTEKPGFIKDPFFGWTHPSFIEWLKEQPATIDGKLEAYQKQIDARNPSAGTSFDGFVETLKKRRGIY